MNKTLSLRSTAFFIFGLEILAIASAIGRSIVLRRDPMRYFGENGYITWISAIQLWIIAILCWQISRYRKQTAFLDKQKRSIIFWYLLAFSMLFMGLDEAFAIHENLDKSLHYLLQIEETSFTSRLDDLFLIIYVVIGLVLLYLFKDELIKFSTCLIWLKRGIYFAIATLFIDILGHNKEVLSGLIANAEKLDTVHHWFTAIEEIPKVLAGGAFLVFFSGCLKIARKLKVQSME
jgi:hypothetical protein